MSQAEALILYHVMQVEMQLKRSICNQGTLGIARGAGEAMSQIKASLSQWPSRENPSHIHHIKHAGTSMPTSENARWMGVKGADSMAVHEIAISWCY